MLQVLPCPQCGKQSLIPNQTSLEATIRCPNCSANLVLGEVLVSQFSSWEVVDDPADAFYRPPRKLDPAVVVPVPAENAEGQISLAPFDPSLDPVAPASQPISRSSGLSEYERRRLKQKSPIWGMIPVVLGGFAAFPIALLIIWHVLGRDIAGLGPQVAEYVPWIVPKRLHPISDPPRPAPGRPAPQRGASGFRNFDNVVPEPKLAPPINDLQKDGDSQSKMMNQQSSDSDNGTDPAENSQDNSKQVPRQPTGAEKQDSENQIIDAAKPDLFSSIRECSALLDELSKAIEAKGENVRSLADESLAKLSNIAKEIALVEVPLRRIVNQQMQPLAKKITQENSKLELGLDRLSKIAVEALSNQKVADPLWLPTTLEVTSAEQLDSNWLVQGNHALPKFTVIEIPRNLSTHITKDQKYWLLGEFKYDDEAKTSAVFQVSYLYRL